LPNVGPYIYDVSISGFTRSSIYIYDISSLRVKVYITIILPLVVYGCETWSLKLSDGRRLRVFENGVLRIFGPKKVEVTGVLKTT